MRFLFSFIMAWFSLAGLRAEEAAVKTRAVELQVGATFPARDTLESGPESQPDAEACLKALTWKVGPFTVQCEATAVGRGEWLIRFPSPFPSGDTINDSVAMEWYMALDEQGRPKRAPAVVVVHESGRSMLAGRAIARGLRASGLHTFLLHLPGYGARTSPQTRDVARMLPALRQAVGDVRRARDAVAALPFVDSTQISLEGTSLGGFVTAMVAGLDRGYQKIFILLAGGQIADVLLHGKWDAAKLRRRLADAGITDDNIRETVAAIEPMRLAHRVDPARTWLFTGKYDDVVPPACSEAFANAAKLGDEHRFNLPVGHYSAALLLPVILPKIAEMIRAK